MEQKRNPAGLTKVYEYAVVTVGMCLMAGAAWGQGVIYRCGNEYTNQARVAKEKGCRPVEGAAVTVVQSGTVSSRPASVARPAAGGGNAPGSENALLHKQEQRSRDGDARAILQAELEKAQQQLSVLREEYKDGNPDRSALELRNPQHYQERLEQKWSRLFEQQNPVAKRDPRGHAACIFANGNAAKYASSGVAWPCA